MFLRHRISLKFSDAIFIIQNFKYYNLVNIGFDLIADKHFVAAFYIFITATTMGLTYLFLFFW